MTNITAQDPMSIVIDPNGMDSENVLPSPVYISSDDGLDWTTKFVIVGGIVGFIVIPKVLLWCLQGPRRGNGLDESRVRRQNLLSQIFSEIKCKAELKEKDFQGENGKPSLNQTETDDLDLEAKQNTTKASLNHTDTDKDMDDARKAADSSDGTASDIPLVIRQKLSSQQTCAICLEAYSSGDCLAWSPNCFHYFHQDCIVDYFGRNRDQTVLSCPFCRNAFLPATKLSTQDEKPENENDTNVLAADIESGDDHEEIEDVEEGGPEMASTDVDDIATEPNSTSR